MICLEVDLEYTKELRELQYGIFSSKKRNLKSKEKCCQCIN